MHTNTQSVFEISYSINCVTIIVCYLVDMLNKQDKILQAMLLQPSKLQTQHRSSCQIL